MEPYPVTTIKYGFSSTGYRDYLKNQQTVAHVKLTKNVSYCRKPIRSNVMTDEDLELDKALVRICESCLSSWEKRKKATVNVKLGKGQLL